MADFFTKEHSLAYDEKNRRLAAITESMHFLFGLALNRTPADAQVLCVGVGTGAEILSLAGANPGWRFVGVEPSASMLEVCRDNLKAAGYLDRCQLITGYVEAAPPGANFDVAISALVAHFIKREDRRAYFQNILDRLKKGGTFLNAEISFDLASPEFPAMLRNWEGVQALMGATPQSLAALPKVLHEMLTVLPPTTTEQLLREAGFAAPLKIFQAFMISAWQTEKP